MEPSARQRLRWILWLGLPTASLAALFLPRMPGLVAMATLRALAEAVAVVAVMGRWRASSEASRAPWKWLAAGLSLLLVGDSLAAAAFGGLDLLPRWASAVLMHLLPVPLFLVALARWPAPQPGAPRVGAAIDGLLFGYASYFLIWSLGLHAWSAEVSATMVVSLYGRFALLGALLGLSVGMGTRDERRWAGPLGYLSAAFGLWTLASALAAGGLLGAGPSPVLRSASYLLKPVSLLLVVEAAWSRAPLEGAAARHVGTVRDHLPYLPAVLAVLAALWHALQGNALEPALLVLATPLIALLVLRQQRALHELKVFSAELEARVLERTRALEEAQRLAVRTERMNAVATLSAGLAHDINNSLATIAIAGSLVDDAVHRGELPTREDCDSIKSAADHAGQLTRRLLQFGRDGGPVEPVDLVEAVTAMRPLLRVVPPPQVQLTFRLHAGPVLIKGRRSHIEQMVMNLVTNARDAIAGAGQILIAIDRGEGPGGPEAVLVVQDSGEGMAPGTRERIFEPFFTTKGPGKGTGLGLSSVRALVEQHRGHIELASAPGDGTTFTLHFPLLAD